MNRWILRKLLRHWRTHGWVSDPSRCLVQLLELRMYLQYVSDRLNMFPHIFNNKMFKEKTTEILYQGSTALHTIATVSGPIKATKRGGEKDICLHCYSFGYKLASSKQSVSKSFVKEWTSNTDPSWFATAGWNCEQWLFLISLRGLISLNVSVSYLIEPVSTDTPQHAVFRAESFHLPPRSCLQHYSNREALGTFLHGMTSAQSFRVSVNWTRLEINTAYTALLLYIYIF